MSREVSEKNPVQEEDRTFGYGEDIAGTGFTVQRAEGPVEAPTDQEYLGGFPSW